MPLIRAPCQPTYPALTCGKPILSGSETPCCRRTWAAHSSCPVGAISERVLRPWLSPSDVLFHANGSYYRLRYRCCFPLDTQPIHFVPSLPHPRTDLGRTSGGALSRVRSSALAPALRHQTNYSVMKEQIPVPEAHRAPRCAASVTLSSSVPFVRQDAGAQWRT